METMTRRITVLQHSHCEMSMSMADIDEMFDLLSDATKQGFIPFAWRTRKEFHETLRSRVGDTICGIPIVDLTNAGPIIQLLCMTPHQKRELSCHANG
jgi:hypothetical protein